MQPSDVTADQAALQSSDRPGRLLSLDAFRGVTVASMILVNNPGDWNHIYAPLEHASWNGWTPTDLIFPFFLFIVGVSITYALGGKVQDNAGVVRKIVKRSFTLFMLGLFLNFFPNSTSVPSVFLVYCNVSRWCI
ncbi:hypothetical protein GCM10027577_20110 [Spirosoma fluminis]